MVSSPIICNGEKHNNNRARSKADVAVKVLLHYLRKLL